jgi:predicted transcriptional regulator
MACFASGVTNVLKIKEFSDRNRSTFDIVAGILRELQEPTGITNIMSNCNISFKQSGSYLSFMNSSDLIQTDAIVGRVRYRRTETGQKFLEAYDKMILLLDPDLFARCSM